jgi:hypothetical protein
MHAQVSGPLSLTFNCVSVCVSSTSTSTSTSKSAAGPSGDAELSSPLPIGPSDAERKQRETERKRAYAQELRKQMPSPPPPKRVGNPHSFTHAGLPIGLTPQEQRIADKEKKRQFFLEVQRTLPPEPHMRRLPDLDAIRDVDATTLHIGLSDGERRQKEVERNRAHQQALLAQMPYPPGTHGLHGLALGHLSHASGPSTSTSAAPSAPSTHRRHSQLGPLAGEGLSLPVGMPDDERAAREAAKRRAYADELDAQNRARNPHFGEARGPREPYVPPLSQPNHLSVPIGLSDAEMAALEQAKRRMYASELSSQMEQKAEARRREAQEQAYQNELMRNTQGLRNSYAVCAYQQPERGGGGFIVHLTLASHNVLS